MNTLRCGQHTVTITHPDKLYFTPNITKGELIDYYYRIADTMLPHMHNRPLTMQRFTEGMFGEGFYHKDSPDYFPDFIRRIEIPKEAGGVTHYVICNNQATLVYLANQGCITPHLWLSKIDKLDYPDKLLFDLDPSTDDFEAVRDAAFEFKEFLEALKLTPYVMTTGSRGVHVMVPIKRTQNFDTVRAVALAIAQELEERSPEAYTTEIRKEKRGKKIFIDTHRIGFGQTAVAPYAVRARAHAPVATPLTWQELVDRKIHAQSFTINSIFDLLATRPDPWKKIT